MTTKAEPTMTPVELAERLSIPEFRQIAERCGLAPGVEVDVAALIAAMAEQGYYATPESAAAARKRGHNIRCNRCGTYGADWVPGQRPGWGALALCAPHEAELREEINGHEKALGTLRRINFEQEIQPVRRNGFVSEW